MSCKHRGDEHLTASQVDRSISSVFASVDNVQSTTGSAASLALEVEAAGDRVVRVVNASAVVMEHLVSVASRLADHPTVSLALGT